MGYGLCDAQRGVSVRDWSCRSGRGGSGIWITYRAMVAGTRGKGYLVDAWAEHRKRD